MRGGHASSEQGSWHKSRSWVNVSRAPKSTARTGGQLFFEHCLQRLAAGRILNVGSGFKSPASPQYELVNIDLDPKVLRGNESSAVAADAACLPFASASFEGAILKDVLEHVPDPVWTLTELARVARPKARIVLTVPRAVPRAVWADPTHRRGSTKRAIVWTLELSRWEVEGRVDRVGSIPGAGRIPLLLKHSHQILRVPGLGHRLGLNWMVIAHRSPSDDR
jgi:SAM-dependent methyltransferase